MYVFVTYSFIWISLFKFLVLDYRFYGRFNSIKNVRISKKNVRVSQTKHSDLCINLIYIYFIHLLITFEVWTFIGNILLERIIKFWKFHEVSLLVKLVTDRDSMCQTLYRCHHILLNDKIYVSRFTHLRLPYLLLLLLIKNIKVKVYHILKIFNK